jgi:ABC-type Fe3+ transport system permease subunit
MSEKLLRVIVVVAMILLVELLCYTGIIPRMVMIAPSDMVVELGKILASGQFSADIQITFTNIAISTVLSVLLGFAAGVIIYRCRACATRSSRCWRATTPSRPSSSTRSSSPCSASARPRSSRSRCCSPWSRW